MKLLNSINYTFASQDIQSAEKFLTIGGTAETQTIYLAHGYTTGQGINLGCFIYCTTTNSPGTATITAKIYSGIPGGGGTRKAKLAEFQLNTGVTATDRFGFIQNIPYGVITGWGSHLFVSIQSDQSGDNSRSVTVFLYDMNKGLDITTVAGAAPMSESDIAAEILSPTVGSTIYPIKVNPDGSVKTKGGLAR